MCKYNCVCFKCIAIIQSDLYCQCGDHPLDSVSVKCQVPLVEVKDCGPDTKRPGHVCCMETNGTIDNATVVDVTSTNKSDGQPRTETIETHLKNKLSVKERQTASRHLTDIQHKYIKAKPEGWKYEDNGNLFKSIDEIRRSAMVSKTRAGKQTNTVGKGRKEHVFEQQSNNPLNNQNKGNIQSKKETQNAKANAKKKKRRNTKRKRLQKQLDRITDKKENENVFQNVVNKISDYFKSPSKKDRLVT